jgi:AcrR family transcriptional regulator
MTMEPVKRRYESPARQAAAAATRERLLVAAETLFVRDGYARTSLRAVAAEAGVSEATVYVAFAGKAALLNQAIIRAVRESGSEPVAVVLRSPPEQVLARLARSHAATMRRAAPLIAIGEGSALMDAELRPLRDEAHIAIRAALRKVGERLNRAGLLRAGLGASGAADLLYAVSNETTYLRFTRDAGRRPGSYAAWLTRTFESLLFG